MTAVFRSLPLELKPDNPADALSALVREFKVQSRFGRPPGDRDYALMAVMSDIVELIGRHPELSLGLEDEVWITLCDDSARSVFYRQLYLLGGAEIDWRERLHHLAIGTELLGIDPNVVLKETPRPPAAPHSYCLA